MATVRALIALLANLALVVAPARGQPVADHLECYRVKDPQARASYTADLTGLAPGNGCIIKVPAKYLCVGTEKTNVHPAPPGGGRGGSPTGAFLCYGLKCPRGTPPPVPIVDQFGSRTVVPRRPPLLCAPAGPPTTTTTTTSTITTSTTTTTTSSTTTTTSSVCGTPSDSGFCGGPCPTGSTCAATSSSTCGCVPDGQLCGVTGFQECGGVCPFVTDTCFTFPTGTGAFCVCETLCGFLASDSTCPDEPACLPGRTCVFAHNVGPSVCDCE